METFIPSFPPFSPTLAHCQMEAKFQIYCSELMVNMLVNFQHLVDPAGGTYRVVEDLADYFWYTRTSPDTKLVDDTEFVLTTGEYANECIVTAKSQSRS